MKKRLQKAKKNLSLVRGAQELRARVEELEETLRAIRNGEVDAVVVSGVGGEQVFTLQGAEHPYRLLVETIDEGAATLSEDGTVLYSNKSFAEMFDMKLERFIGSRLREFVGTAEAESLDKLILEGKTAVVRGELRTRMGTERPRTIRLTLSPNRELGVDTICVVATELTELIETNEALRVTEISLRQLSARLLQLQDEERRRIARDLHDITGQKIAVVSMALDRLARLIDPRKREVKEALTDSREIIRDIGEEIRTLSYLLHPPLLDELGLGSAIHWYAEGFEKRSGIRLEVTICPELTRLPSEVETTLFRVLQESLTNVHRYSGSPKAQIRVAVDPSGHVRLEIIDQGKGAHAAKTHASLKGGALLGVGIPGMRERLRQLGGQLEVDFGTQGTRVVATVPVRAIAVEKELPTTEETHASTNGNSVPALAQHSFQEARCRILIADDHEVMRRGLRGLVEGQEEWAVCGEAVEGKGAVQKFRELRPDLVILDVNMPGLTGIEAAEQILREDATARIIFFTVHESDQMLKEIANLGAHGYVAKSRAGQDLVDAVRSVLAGKRFFPKTSVYRSVAEIVHSH